MSKIGPDLLLDCSTPSEFIFSLHCAECGEVWRSRPVRFSRAGVKPMNEGKQVIFDTLYKREKKEALQRATEEAAEVFSQCPICHRLVCDHCFLICEELDMCISCAAHLQEHGTPVTQRTDHRRFCKR